MAPEVITNQKHSFPCDIWSLGCVAFEMVEKSYVFRNHDEKLELDVLKHRIENGIFKPFENT